MSTADKIAEHAVNAIGGALALMGINAGGAVTIVKSMMGLASLGRSLSGDPATEARTRAIAATLDALAASADFARADSGRVTFLLTEANFRNLTPAALLEAVHAVQGTDIGPPLAAVLASHLPFDLDDADTVAVVGLALTAAAQALARETGFRESLRDLILMDLVRRHRLQDQFMTDIDAKLDRLLAEKDETARKLGITQALLFGLAWRINRDVNDEQTAYLELDRALTLAAQMRDQAALPSDTGDPVEEVLRRLSALNDQNRLDEGADLIAAELARLDAQKARLYDAAIDQDILRRNAPSAARWLVERLKADTPPDLFAALRALQDDWYVRGSDGGLNFEAEVAIHLAHAAHAHATTPDQRGAALNDLGNALLTLGEREPGTARLEDAVTAYRAALEELTRDRVPLQWAKAQMNLGTALRSFGEREPGTARLEEAVVLFRAALEVQTRDEVPLDWAMTQTNLGYALSNLVGRGRGSALEENAVTAFRSALEEYTRDREAELCMNLGDGI